MVDISENGKKALRIIFTDFFTNYNSHNIADKIGISNVGSLKLLRSLKEKNILVSEKMGNAIFYKPNLENEYVLKLLELIFLDHSSLSNYLKGWILDLKSFSTLAKSILLFGSILSKGKNAGDVDVCFILDGKDYVPVQRKIHEMDVKSRLKIHPLLLTEKRFEEKLKEKDKPLVDMVKNCVVVHGQELFVKVLKNVQS